MELRWNYDGTRMEGSTTMELQWNGMALMGHRRNALFSEVSCGRRCMMELEWKVALRWNYNGMEWP